MDAPRKFTETKKGVFTDAFAYAYESVLYEMGSSDANEEKDLEKLLLNLGAERG